MGRTGPYLAAGRPDPGSRGPSGAGSPSGRRGEAAAGRRGHRPGGHSASRLLPQSAAPRHHLVRAWAPLQSGWQPQDDWVCSPSLLRKTRGGQGARLLSQTWALGLWALLPPRPDPLPRSGSGKPPAALALTVFQLVLRSPGPGSRGASGPPLLTLGSWIHTEGRGWWLQGPLWQWPYA